MQELYKKSSLALLRAKKRMKADDDPTFLEGARRILDFMYSAWQDQKCCDLIIKVTGGDIHAHSVAFGAYSETLTNSFYGYSNGEIITLDLSDFRREVVLAIVNFLYTTELELNCHIIGQALSCATKLGMDIIVHMCMDYLSRVSVDNAVLHYSIAENNNLKELRDNILRFLLENFSNVSSSKHFVYLPFNRLIAILKNENLHVNDEVDVFRAVVRWVDHERSSRIEHSTELLQCVRFPLMPAEVLASEVETSDWIFVNQELWRDCLYKAMKYNALNGSEGNPGQPSPHSLASISSKSQDGRRLGGMESNGEKMAGDSSGVRGKGFESIDQYQGQEMMRSDLSANSSGHQGSSSPQLGQPRTSQMGQAWSSHQIQQQRSSGDLTSRSTQQLQPRASQQQPAQLPQQQRSAHQLAQQRQSTNQMLHQRQSLHQLQQANVSQHSTQQMQEMQMRQCSKQINSEVQRKSNHQFQQSPQSQSHQSLTSQQNSLNSQLQQKSQISQQLFLQAQQSERMTSQVGLLNQGQSPRSQVSSGILSPNYSALRPSSSRQSSGQGQRNSTMSLPLDAKTSARSYQQFLASVPGSAKADLLANNASANAASSMQRLTSQDSFLMSEESMLCSPQYMHYNECDKGFLGESLTGDMDGLMMYRPDDKNFLDDDDPEVVYETNVDNQSCLCDYTDGAQLGMMPSYQEQIMKGFPGKKLQASQTYIGNDKLGVDQLVVVGVGGIDLHSESLDVPGKIACVYEAGSGGKGGQWKECSERISCSTHHHGVAVIGSKIFVIGGAVYKGGENLGSPIDSFIMYDSSQEKWQSLPRLSEPRAYLAGAAWRQSVFAVGGETSNKVKLDSIASYDLIQNVWKELTKIPGGGRVGPAVAVHQDGLFVVGGYNKEVDRSGVLSDVSFYDLLYDSWIQLNPLSVPRCHAGLLEVEGTLMLVGGRTRQKDKTVASLDDLLVYNIDDDEWEERTNMEQARHDMGCTAIGPLLYIVGGIKSPKPECMTSMECYNVKTGQWLKDMPPYPYPTAGLGLVSVSSPSRPCRLRATQSGTCSPVNRRTT